MVIFVGWGLILIHNCGQVATLGSIIVAVLPTRLAFQWGRLVFPSKMQVILRLGSLLLLATSLCLAFTNRRWLRNICLDFFFRLPLRLPRGSFNRHFGEVWASRWLRRPAKSYCNTWRSWCRRTPRTLYLRDPRAWVSRTPSGWDDRCRSRQLTNEVNRRWWRVGGKRWP